MKFFDEISRHAPNRIFISLAMGVFAGITYTLLIPIVLNSLNSLGNLEYQQDAMGSLFGFKVDNVNMAWLYTGAVLVILFCTTMSQVMLARISSDVTSKLRQRLYQRILNCPLAAVEQVGSPRLMASLTTDVQNIIIGAKTVPMVIASLFTIFSMLGFLWYLSPDVFQFVLAAIFIGIVTYQVPMLIGNASFSRARVHIDTLHESIRGLTLGVKELKLNRQKRNNFVEQNLLQSEKDVVENEKFGNTVITAALNYGSMISFGVIGMVAFVLINYQPLSNDLLIAVFMVLLYITGPITGVLGSIPAVIVANISYNKLQALLEEMPDEGFAENVETGQWQVMTLKDIKFKYDGSSEGRNFAVGPINLQMKRGEVVFLVGGNGSGKSTLSKLITQHYQPVGGAIYFDDVKVGPQNINGFRQKFSSIYSDYYLFDTVLDAKAQGEALHKQIDSYLTELDLADKVTYQNNRFSTLNLSDGQRRRLALLVSYLEDKDIYLFDEWAADQDPEFREIYYHKILPELKQRGKLVVVVTHDSRYFDCADKVVWLDQGQIAEIEEKKEVECQAV